MTSFSTSYDLEAALTAGTVQNNTLCYVNASRALWWHTTGYDSRARIINTSEYVGVFESLAAANAFFTTAEFDSFAAETRIRIADSEGGTSAIYSKAAATSTAWTLFEVNSPSVLSFTSADNTWQEQDSASTAGTGSIATVVYYATGFDSDIVTNSITGGTLETWGRPSDAFLGLNPTDNYTMVFDFGNNVSGNIVSSMDPADADSMWYIFNRNSTYIQKVRANPVGGAVTFTLTFDYPVYLSQFRFDNGSTHALQGWKENVSIKYYDEAGNLMAQSAEVFSEAKYIDTTDSTSVHYLGADNARAGVKQIIVEADAAYQVNSHVIPSHFEFIANVNFFSSTQYWIKDGSGQNRWTLMADSVILSDPAI